MNNGIQIIVTPAPLILDLLDLLLVTPLKDPITGYMISLLRHIVLDRLKYISIVDTDTLEHGEKIIRLERAVGAAMGLARPRGRLCKQFLAGIRRVAAATTVCVTSDVAVGVTDVVFVLFLEFLIGDELEAAAPEDDTFV